MSAMQWLAHGEHEVPDDTSWLSDRERDYAAGIRFRKRYDEFLTRRYTAKRAVAAVFDLAVRSEVLAAIEVRNRPSGAPYLEIQGEAAPADLSLSDRAGWAVCLVGPVGSIRSGTLGIDLEVVEPRSERFIQDFLTPTEMEWVRAHQPGEDRDAAANLVWSAKEAALKVRQVGLRHDTRTVEVQWWSDPEVDGWCRLQVSATDGQRYRGWWRRDRQFVLTVAAVDDIEPPALIDGNRGLEAAQPIHSWLGQPERIVTSQLDVATE